MGVESKASGRLPRMEKSGSWHRHSIAWTNTDFFLRHTLYINFKLLAININQAQMLYTHGVITKYDINGCTKVIIGSQKL